MLPAFVAVAAIVGGLWVLTGPRATATADAARLKEIGERLGRMEARSEARFEKLQTQLDGVEARLLAEIRLTL